MLHPMARLLRSLLNASAKLPLLLWTVHRPQVSSHKMSATHVAANVMCLLHDSLPYTPCTGRAPCTGVDLTRLDTASNNKQSAYVRKM